MQIQDASTLVEKPDVLSESNAIPELVGRLYETAPVADKVHLLEHLLRPLGVMVYGLARIVSALPALDGSALAALLVSALLRRAREVGLQLLL
jgi:hypothetical protein